MRRISLAHTGIAEAAQIAAEILGQGGVVLYPTDTLYGLAVDAGNPEAMRKLYAIKARNPHKPVSVLVPDLAAAEELVELTDEARALARKFFPGALTIVARGKGSGESVGIRIPDNPFCLALARTFGKPYTATSANLAGAPDVTTVDAILAQLGEHAEGIDLVVDDGARASSVPSTVISFVHGKPELVREGAIPARELGLNLD